MDGEDNVPATSQQNSRTLSAAVVLGCAVVLLWPAFLNRWPLSCPDSVSYTMNGWTILAWLKGPHFVLPPMRAELFSTALAALTFHKNFWSFVVVQATLTSWVLFTLQRALLPGKFLLVRHVVLIICLSAFTQASWFASDIMADILGPLVYLSLFLLVFAADRLDRTSRWALAAVAVWGIMAHTTHLLTSFAVLLALALCYPLAKRVQGHRVGYAFACGAFIAAILLQTTTHRLLYGLWTVNGEQPPYLMSRIIADGTGAMYLRNHCAQLRWQVCRSVDHLPKTDTEFLWQPGGIWASATPPQRRQLRQEEMPFVLHTIRAFPQWQGRVTLNSWLLQLRTVELIDVVWPSVWTAQQMDMAVDRGTAAVKRTRQYQQTMPWKGFSQMDLIVDEVSLWLGFATFIRAVIRRQFRFVALALTTAVALLTNAFVCSAFSGVYPRYQARVVWLLPLVVMVSIAGRSCSLGTKGPE